MFSDNTLCNDVIATVLSGGVALSLLRLWEETAKRGIFDQNLNRKIVHVTVGLVFMLCWPMFSYDAKGAVLAALVPGVNIIKMLLLGLGIWKDEKTVKSMSRFGDHRELIKGPLYYASTITWACFMYWRTSPIAIASICNLCAGDGIFFVPYSYIYFFCLVRFGILYAAWFPQTHNTTPFTSPFRYGRYCGEAFRKSETSLQQQQNNSWHCRYGNCWFLGLHRIHVLFLLLWIHSRKHGDDSRVLDRVPCFCSCRIPSTEHQG